MKIKEFKVNDKNIAIHLCCHTPGEFNMFALNQQKCIVAKCAFDITNTYVLQKPVLISSCTPSTCTSIQKGLLEFKKLDNCTINSAAKRDKITMLGGNIFSLKETYCKLQLIEICDEGFYKVGLGRELFKLMEAFAKQQHCNKISAWVHPHGPFQMGTMQFYVRNGFSFEKDATNHTIATKNLAKVKEKTK